MATHVESLIFFIHQGLLLVKVCIGLVHPWVSALAQGRISLMFLGWGSLRDFALHVVLKILQSIQGRVILVNHLVCWLAVK